MKIDPFVGLLVLVNLFATFVVYQSLDELRKDIEMSQRASVETKAKRSPKDKYRDNIYTVVFGSGEHKEINERYNMILFDDFVTLSDNTQYRFCFELVLSTVDWAQMDALYAYKAQLQNEILLHLANLNASDVKGRRGKLHTSEEIQIRLKMAMRRYNIEVRIHEVLLTKFSQTYALERHELNERNAP